MSLFNPDTPDNLNKDYLISRGSESSLKGIGIALKDKGDLIQAEAQAGKANIELGIDEEVRNGMSPMRDSYTHYLEEKKYLGGPLEDLPKGVESGLSRLSAMTDAKDAGRLDESHYFNLLDAKARELRAQHPGFRDYVDQRISALIGGNPANKLVEALHAEAKAGMSASDKEKDYWLKQNHELGSLILPDGSSLYEARIAAGKPMSTPELRETAMRAKAAQVKVDQLEKQTTLRRSLNADSVMTYKNAATSEVSTIVSNAISLASGPMAEFKKKLSDSDSRMGPDGARSKEDTEQLNMLFAKAEMHLKTVTNEAMTRVRKDEKGAYSYAEKITDKKDRDEVTSLVEDMIAPWKYAMYNKDSGAMHMLKNLNELGDSAAEMDLSNNVKMARSFKAVQKMMGPAAQLQSMWADSDALKEVANIRLVDNMFKSVLGESSLDRATREAFKHGDKGVGPELIARHIDMLKDPKLAPEAYKNSMKFMFGKDNDGFLTKKDEAGNFTLGTTDSYNTYMKMVGNPDFVNNVVKNKSRFPEEYAKFREFATTNFNALMAINGREAQRLIESSDSYNLEYDPKTNMLRPIPFERAGIPPSLAIANYKALISDPASIKATDQLNKVIGGVSTLIKAEGGDPAKEIPVLLEKMIDFKAPKTDYLGRVVKAMEKATETPGSTKEKTSTATTTKEKAGAEEPGVPVAPRSPAAILEKPAKDDTLKLRNSTEHYKYDGKDWRVWDGKNLGDVVDLSKPVPTTKSPLVDEFSDEGMAMKKTPKEGDRLRRGSGLGEVYRGGKWEPDFGQK